MLCQPNPCRNSGRCEQLNADTFQCHCVDPFEGDRCQLGGCKTRPCLNWGQCSDLFEPNEEGLGMLFLRKRGEMGALRHPSGKDS